MRKSKRSFYEEWGVPKKTGRKFFKPPTQMAGYTHPHRYLKVGDVLQFEDAATYGPDGRQRVDINNATVIRIVEPPEEPESGFYRLELLWDDGDVSIDEFHTLEFEIITEMEIDDD